MIKKILIEMKNESVQMEKEFSKLETEMLANINQAIASLASKQAAICEILINTLEEEYDKITHIEEEIE